MCCCTCREYKAVIWSLSVFIVIGFVFFDLLYVAVILNYCSQCTLLHFYVINVCEKIRHKAYPLGDAVKVSDGNIKHVLYTHPITGGV